MSTFPGGTSVSFLDVYTDIGPDGLRGGSPHVHLASTECYLVIGGAGRLQTLSMNGYEEIELTAGTITWFTPGVIHRAVNDDDLRVIVLMSNAGLPEAGDAVMTFPPEDLADPTRYREIAALPDRPSEIERAADAARRRDRAVTGFLTLRTAALAGEVHVLEQFYADAARLVTPRVDGWDRIVAEGPQAQLNRTQVALSALRSQDLTHLALAQVQTASLDAAEPRFGMCGRLRPLS
ncbi:cupin domain-containing protein [Rathayibacter sp. VKM Ac-2835]|uniref:cupin domain-containing protein n=1 Tax=Rathayibacter sp. VKM Ac-2835 TaxID=2739043 RepID=UPI0015677ED9|nr:cupin domain-containing protein [Rathayibacter sp. VKM Ac-2835]NRG43024.1 cupin domain-containing protein [Rathayibacter sp. VKM Ac-2835]